MPNKLEDDWAAIHQRTGIASGTPTTDVQSVTDSLKTDWDNILGQETEAPAQQTGAIPIPEPKPLTPEEIATDELDSSLRRAATANPTQEAQNRKLAKGLDLPQELLPEDASEQLFLKQNDAADLQRTHPAVARYLALQDNAAIVGQNVEELKGIEYAMRRFVGDPLLDLLKGTVAAPQTAAGFGALARVGVPELVSPIFRNILESIPAIREGGDVVTKARRAVESTVDFKATQEILDTFMSPERQEAQRKLAEAQGFFPSLGTAIEHPSVIAGAVIQSVPSLGLSGAFAQQLMKQFPKLGALYAAAVGEGLTIAGSSAEQIRGETAEGELEVPQALLAVGAGVAGTGINILGGKIAQKMGFTDIDTAIASGTLKQALDVSGMPTRLVTRVLTGAVGEGLEELGQSAVEQIAQNVALERPWDEGVPEAMAIGLLAGGALGGGVNLITTPPSSEVLNRAIDTAAAKEVKNMSRAQQAADDKESLEAYGKSVSESKLRSRDPEAFKEFVKTMADEEGNISEVYVDAEQLNESLAQSGLTPEELQQKMPELAQELKVAQEVQGEVRISIEDYATYIAGSPAEVSLLEHLRVSPEGMTFKESQEYFQQQEASLTEQAQQLVEENSPVLDRAEFQTQQPEADYNEYLKTHQNKVEAFATDAKEVHDKILTGLNTTGRFTKAVNASYAIPFREFFAVNAAREGILPSELYARMPLNFRSMTIGGETLTQEVTQKLPATLNIAGVDRPTTNNLGQQIHPAEEGVRNFWEWFGDSKVVDEEGRPKVVYHGTSVEFDKIDLDKGAQGLFWFSSDKESILAGERGAQGVSKVMGLYAKIDNPAGWRQYEQLSTGELSGRGYDGVILDEKDGSFDGFVYKDDVQIKSAIGNIGTFDPADPNILRQKERASYNPATFTISLLEGSDLSSTIHEGAHFYLEALSDMARRPDAPEQIKADFQKTMDWFGVTEPWHEMTLEAKRVHHEQWAQSFERYALEGKAPTTEMQPVFARFRTWMLSVYKSLREFLEQNPLAGKLNDEIRSVFDRLLAAEDAIKDTEKARGYAPLFATAEEAGATQRQFEEYLEEGSTATAKAVDDLSSRSLRDMRWLSNAKDRIIRELQAEAKDKRAAIRAEVTNEVMSEPINQARTFLRKGEISNEDGTVTQAQETFKLNTKDIKSLQPGIDLTRLRGMTSPDGVHPDFAANMFGFSSGDALLTELVEGEKPKDKIDGLTDARMLEEHGDLIDNRAVERAAEKAIHNEARARFMATGLKMLTKSAISSSQLNRAAKQAAESAITQKKIREITPGQYARAEARANKEAIKKAAKDPNGAITAQRAALLNNRLVKASTEAQAEVDRLLKYLRKFESPKVRKKIEVDYWEQIRDLLQAFDLRKGVTAKALDKRQSLADWIAEQEANGYEPAMDPALLDDLKRKHYKDMTLEELLGLVEGVKQIEHFGRFKHRLLTAKDKREFGVRADEADASIRANANRTVKERATPTDNIGKTARWLRQATAGHRKFNSIIREMDGGKDGGVMWKLLSRPLNEAGDNETEMKQLAAVEFHKLFKELPRVGEVLGSVYARKRLVPGTNISMSHENRVMFAVNWGNAGNRQRLLDGGLAGHKALSTKQAEAILDTLTKADWDFVQGVLDHASSYKARVAELEKRLTGVEPEWIDATPMVTKFGTYPGGYFPAKYDAELSTRSESFEAVTDSRMAMKRAFGSSATRSSFAKQRAKEVKNRPIKLTYDVIAAHVSEVTHRLAWQPFLVDANRLLKALDQPIREHYGPEILREMSTLIDDVAEGGAPAKNAMETALNHLRTGATILGLGWRFSTALMQPTGLAQSWVRIGAGPMSRGIARYLANPNEAARFVDANSKLMRDRDVTMTREINDVLNTIRVGEKLSVVTTSYFTMIQKMQRAVDTPTWLGAYEKALAELRYENAVDETMRQDLDEQAKQMANQAVIDSQSGGQLKDLARVQRGGPAWKLFTNFFSYLSATYNLNIEAVRKTDFRSPLDLLRLASDMIVLNTIPVILVIALKEMLRPECKDDMECYVEKFAQEQISFLAGQTLLTRELSPAIEAAAGFQTFGYQGPAGLRFLTDAQKLGVQIGQGEADAAFISAANRVGGLLLHYPAGQVELTVRGIHAIERGDVEGVGVLQALLAGPPR